MRVRGRDREKEKREAAGKSRGWLLQEGERGSRAGLVELRKKERPEEEVLFSL